MFRLVKHPPGRRAWCPRRAGLRRRQPEARADPRDRGQGRRRDRDDLPPLPDSGGSRRRRLPPPGRGVRRGRHGPAGRRRLSSRGTTSVVNHFVDFLIAKHGSLTRCNRTATASTRCTPTFLMSELVWDASHVLRPHHAPGSRRAETRSRRSAELGRRRHRPAQRGAPGGGRRRRDGRRRLPRVAGRVSRCRTRPSGWRSRCGHTTTCCSALTCTRPSWPCRCCRRTGRRCR